MYKEVPHSAICNNRRKGTHQTANGEDGSHSFSSDSPEYLPPARLCLGAVDQGGQTQTDAHPHGPTRDKF